jgi:hypothetical protein
MGRGFEKKSFMYKILIEVTIVEIFFPMNISMVLKRQKFEG